MGKGFEELEAYQVARGFRNRVFNLTRQLPADEKYVLTSQMRRAALSITNSIAEGHGSRSYRHNISYLYRARGSVYELQDDMNACEDQGYFEKRHLDDLREHSTSVAKLLNGYVTYLRKRLTDKNDPAETKAGSS
ncbi:MAG: four helix bundle protein [Planctomycetota bacterium]|jgi:four helix bundle protein